MMTFIYQMSAMAFESYVIDCALHKVILFYIIILDLYKICNVQIFLSQQLSRKTSYSLLEFNFANIVLRNFM